MPTYYIRSSKQAVDVICTETARRFFLQIPHNVRTQAMITNIRSYLHKYDLHVKMADANYGNRKVIVVTK